jgi:penicillin-insensitive murein endopeptidase
MRRQVLPALAAMLALASSIPALAQESQCYGVINSGRIEGAVQIPAKGPNFEIIGARSAPSRTFVHTAVRKILVESYAALAATLPDARFLVGETGLENGGPITFHFTHQRGTSVDLFVPVKTLEGKRALFPSRLENGFGYRVRLDRDGKTDDGNYVLDAEALAEYIYQLSETAARNGHGIDRVILVREFQAQLLDTRHGAYLRRLRFWDDPGARHDNHIHVDFDIPCKLF